jgi:hypothetical protein
MSNESANANQYRVVIIETGETTSEWDSLYLAKKSVSAINRSIGRRVAKVVENK